MCIRDRVNSLYWGGENGFEAPVKYCSEIDLEDRGVCFDRLYSNVLSYRNTPGLNQAVCLSVPTEYQAGCQAKLLPKTSL